MRLTFPSMLGAGLSLWLLAGPNTAGTGRAEPALASVDFTRRIRPILSENCLACHGPDEKKRKAGLRLDLKSEAFKKLKSDNYAIVPGDLERSELVRRLTTADDDERMPPPKSGKHLTPDQINLLRQWVAEGAPYKDHWAYLKPEHPALPEVQLKTWPRNPIDFFVLARLEKEGLKPMPEASKEALIRRVSLDLTGLPPSNTEIDQFLRDNRSDAYAQLVERLLASPRYGERWARPWLDQARYADSNGYEADFRRSIWPYRDWVIRALNRDLPFDQFTVEQLAGDLLPNATQDQKIATGFHRNTMVNTEGGTDEEEFRIAALVDRVNTTFGVWMGTTLGCAQCHSHKYDPFTQREYYQVMAFFNQTNDKGRSNDPEMELPTPEQKAKRDEIRAKIPPLEKLLNTQTMDLDQAMALWLAEIEGDRDAIDSGWHVLDPVTLEAAGGVTLQKLPEGVVLAGGALPDTSIYELSLPTVVRGITAFRLEALADESLPGKSSGRSEDGDFVVTEFTVQALPVRDSAPASPDPPKMSSWQMIGPFHAATVGEAFSREFIGEPKVDLAQAFEQGKHRWTEQPTFRDGVVHELAGDNSATYLYRTITTSEAMPLMVSLGSDDGLQVWLNGKKVLSRDVERPVAPNQDSVELQLTKGENRLLMKINNGAGNSGFYFAVSDDQSGVYRASFEAAYADFSMEKYDVKDAVDGKPKTGWSIAAFEPTNRVDHQAVFVVKQSIGFAEGTRLVFKIKQESDRRQHLLGKFRLALSTAPVEAHQAWAKVPASIRSLLQKRAEDRNTVEDDELAKYYRGIDPTLDHVRDEIAALRKQEPKDIATTLVMEPAKEPRATYMLIRGSHLNKGDEVQAGTPAVLHPWPSGQPTNRLGLARWLVDPANPLVGRVTLNRIWAQYFGRGLVETSEEFGAQGELPTHADLLDWLATEFIRQGWSLKAIHRQVATSATYRQSAEVTPEALERDPFNRLFTRGPRFRMEAEMLRDAVLATGGLLSDKIGGPSVFPHQPEGVWNSPYNGDRWVLSKQGDQFRRGLYTFWRRTAPYASFAAFDAPSREVMCERRARSNTPIQALVTLNDPAFLSAASGLAHRILTEAGNSPAERLQFAVHCCLGREPTPNEKRPLVKLYEESLQHFQANESAAKAFARLDPEGDSEKAGVTQRAVWTVIANVLLNLDETLTK